MLEHLCYCTNIHPGETWLETLTALKKHTLTVRDMVLANTRNHEASYPVGLRLSALAAKELLEGENLKDFQFWLYSENLYVYTINGFPYGDFHHTAVKENVYRPDWSSQDRLLYTADLISIIAELAPPSLGGSVSTLPASFKAFGADENAIFANLYACAKLLATLSELHSKDLHLGLEPEPCGNFETTGETIAFFLAFHQWAEDKNKPSDIITNHIGVNYDTCHFALQFENATTALTDLTEMGIRISKIHLSNALEIDLSSENALEIIKGFDEPTYLHQVIVRAADGRLSRFPDIPDFLASETTSGTARIHFHIPLHAQPESPLSSTIQHTRDTLHYLAHHPEMCAHLEMETYTWDVLPPELQSPIEEQLTKEHLWVLESQGITFEYSHSCGDHCHDHDHDHGECPNKGTDKCSGSGNCSTPCK